MYVRLTVDSSVCRREVSLKERLVASRRLRPTGLVIKLCHNSDARQSAVMNRFLEIHPVDLNIAAGAPPLDKILQPVESERSVKRQTAAGAPT